MVIGSNPSRVTDKTCEKENFSCTLNQFKIVLKSTQSKYLREMKNKNGAVNTLIALL